MGGNILYNHQEPSCGASMPSNEEQKPIDHVFAEMKAKGLVASKRVLRRKKADWPLDFGSDRLTHRIYYNERHSSLEDNLLRLALLHEERHLTSVKTPKVWSQMDAIGAVVFGILISTLMMMFGICVAAIIALPLLIVAMNASQRLFRSALRGEETRADLGAAGTLINEFGIRKPSLVAASLFRALRARPRDRTSMTYRVKRLLAVDFHPSDGERVKSIQELEESLAKGDDAHGNAIH